MPNLHSVQFDLSGCTLREESPEHRMWSNAASVYHVLRVTPTRTTWTFDLRDASAASAFYGRQCAENGGVMLAMAVVQVGPYAALQGMFKYRSPVPNSLAMMFVHILWIPFQDWIIQINIESVELGTTGMREAAVMIIEGDNWPMPAAAAEPIAVTGLDDMFARMAAQPLHILPSDHEKYDKTFPDHPLSKVRARMTEVTSSLTISASRQELKPFRQPAWWQALLGR